MTKPLPCRSSAIIPPACMEMYGKTICMPLSLLKQLVFKIDEPAPNTCCPSRCVPSLCFWIWWPSRNLLSKRACYKTWPKGSFRLLQPPIWYANHSLKQTMVCHKLQKKTWNSWYKWSHRQMGSVLRRVSSKAKFCSKSKIHFFWQVHKPILPCTGVGSDLSTREKIRG